MGAAGGEGRRRGDEPCWGGFAKVDNRFGYEKWT